MKLRDKLSLWNIGGGWELSLYAEALCSHGEGSSSDTILASIRRTLLGTLRQRLSSALRVPGGVNYPLKGTTVYIVRLDKEGRRRMARPCKVCLSSLREYGVKEIRYTTDDGWRRELV